MEQHIKGPITLRVTDAEVIESQLAEDDQRALGLEDADVMSEVRCDANYCGKGYSGPKLV